MIADVAFDAPLAPFSYRVPAGWALAPGQRVLAPLRGAARVGVVVAVRPGDAPALKPLARVLDEAPLLDAEAQALVAWIAAESLTSLGATWLSLLPPVAPHGAVRAAPPGEAPSAASPGPAGVLAAARLATAPAASEPAPGPAVELLVGAAREAELAARLAGAQGALVVVPDVEAAARWAERLARDAPVGRLDSGVSDAERARAWRELAAGRLRRAVGTRAALLAPLPPGATLALVDEHDTAHRPPGPPRLHPRDIALERARRVGLALWLTAATPSVEAWALAARGGARLTALPPGPWPTVQVADTRGLGRREALTPTLLRALRDALAAGRRALLLVTRLTSALGCDECGTILRCARCAIALAYSPAGRTLACRLCAATLAPPPDTCPTCRGRRLLPVGWGAERVAHAVARRFPRARIARYEPERGGRAAGAREAARAADVVVGARGALRLFAPGTLGLAAFLAPDQLLGLPDFRAAERAFALMWAAAERVRSDGTVVVQTQNPTHPAVTALVKQSLEAFYGPELRFRAELGYPPYRRLARLTVTAPAEPERARLVARLQAALAEDPALEVYPPRLDRRGHAVHLVVKGDEALPRRLAAALARAQPEGPGSGGRARRRGMIDAEVDPVEWPS